jgi:hypothetical protein
MYLRDFYEKEENAHHLMAQARDCYLPHFKGNEWTPAGFDAVTKEPTQWSIRLTQPAGRKPPKYMVHLEDAEIVVREIEATGGTGKRLMITVKLADEGEERIARYCSTATAENGLPASNDLGIGWFISHSLPLGRWPESNPNNMLKAFGFRPHYSAVLSEQRFRNHITNSLPAAKITDPDRASDMEEFISKQTKYLLIYDFRRDHEVYEHMGHLTEDDQPEWEEKYLVYIPDEFECQLITAISIHLEAWLTVLNTGLYGFDFEGETVARMTYEYILGVDCVNQLLKSELPKEVAKEIKELNQLTADTGHWQQRAEAAETQLKIEQDTIEALQKEIDRLHLLMTSASETVYRQQKEVEQFHLTELSKMGALANDALQNLLSVSLEEKQLQVVMLWSAGEINTRRACLTLGMSQKELERLKASLITSALGNVFKPMRPLYNWSHKEIPAGATHLTSQLNSRGKPGSVWAWKAGEGGMSYRDGEWHGGERLQIIYPQCEDILTDPQIVFDCPAFPLETLEARPGERTE